MISREQLERWKALADALPAWKRTDDGGLVGPPQEFGLTLSDEELCEMFEIGTVTAFAREAVPALLAEIERLRADLANSVRLGPPRRSEPFVFDPEDTYGGVLMAEKDVAAANEIERLREALTSASMKPCELICWIKSSDPCQEFYPMRADLWCASCIARAALKEEA